VWSSGTTLGDSQLIQSATVIYTTTRNLGVGAGSSAASAPLHAFGPVADWTAKIQGSTTSGSSYGLLIRAGTTSADTALSVQGPTGTPSLLFVRGDGNVGIGTAIPYARVSARGSAGVGIGAWSTSGASPGTPVAASLFLGDDNFYNASFYNQCPGLSAVFDVTRGNSAALALYYYNGTNRAEGVRLDGSGNVGIGTASPGAQLHVERAGGSSTNAEYLRLRNTTIATGSNASQSFFVNGNTVATGNISHAWNGTTYDTIFNVWNGSALAEAGRAIGGSTPVLSVPSGLKLPATPGNVDAQTLDCYQENPLATTAGNGWTPTLSAAATWGGTQPTVDYARYIRIGSMVFCEVRLSGAALTATYGTTTISQPPVTINATAIESAVPVSTAAGSGVGVCTSTTVFLPTLGATTAMRLSWFYFTTS